LGTWNNMSKEEQDNAIKQIVLVRAEAITTKARGGRLGN